MKKILFGFCFVFLIGIGLFCAFRDTDKPKSHKVNAEISLTQSAEETADILENIGNGYSAEMLASELKAFGYSDSEIDEVRKRCKNEDFSGQANMQIGLLKKQGYTGKGIKEILEDLGFKEKDYEKLFNEKGEPI